MSLVSRSSLVVLVLSSICLSMSSAEFCLVKSVETKPVRRSYLEQVKTPKTYTCCPNLTCDPPICTKYETVMEKKWKVEMVTARVTRKKCCPGYKTEGDTCHPLCPGGCVHGSCSAPHQCTCSPGYRGHSCELYGCPPDTWGVGCQYQCQCRHFGSCHPATGECTCPPGYGGDMCQEVLSTSTTKNISATTPSVTTSTTSTTSSTTTTTATTISTSPSTVVTTITTITIKHTTSTTISSTPAKDTGTKDKPTKGKISAKMSAETVLIPEDLLIVLLSSLLLLLFIIAVILTVIYYRCRIKVMRNKHISKEMDRNKKAMQNDYVKKLAAAKVMEVDMKDYKNEGWDNFETENLKNNDDRLIDLEEHEYTPMNQNYSKLERPHYKIRKLT